jgi:uncharacterized transporter YbjL
MRMIVTMIKSVKDVKSVHIKECWPYQYVAPLSYQARSQEARDKRNAKKREDRLRLKSATVKTTDGKKLVKLPVYDMTDSICERLNNESQSRF